MLLSSPLHPIALWQSRMLEHATRTLNQNPVHMLSHSIELGRVRRRKLLDYTAVAVELGHLARLLFPAIIALEHLDTAVCLSLSKCKQFRQTWQAHPTCFAVSIPHTYVSTRR